MDIAEKRSQDGRATYVRDGEEVDIRIASLPTVYGENITLRLLEVSMSSISLQDLAWTNELKRSRSAIRRPHGQVLITGPTGSGKSTSLYAALRNSTSPGSRFTVRTRWKGRCPESCRPSSIQHWVDIRLHSPLSGSERPRHYHGG